MSTWKWQDFLCVCECCWCVCDEKEKVLQFDLKTQINIKCESKRKEAIWFIYVVSGMNFNLNYLKYLCLILSCKLCHFSFLLCQIKKLNISSISIVFFFIYLFHKTRSAYFGGNNWLLQNKITTENFLVWENWCQIELFLGCRCVFSFCVLGQFQISLSWSRFDIVIIINLLYLLFSLHFD